MTCFVVSPKNSAVIFRAMWSIFRGTRFFEIMVLIYYVTWHPRSLAVQTVQTSSLTSMKVQKKSEALCLLGRFRRLSVILRFGVASRFFFILPFLPGVGVLARLGVRLGEACPLRML
jgi:uncharacterized membrane protein